MKTTKEGDILDGDGGATLNRMVKKTSLRGTFELILSDKKGQKTKT